MTNEGETKDQSTNLDGEKADPWVNKWKLKDPHVCRVFFSSPFNGMEGEREAFTSLYWPQIQSRCKARGVQFVPVDMRWGITEEHASNSQTVSICLREIDRSDMFVGFFGARYGWYGENNSLLQKNYDFALEEYPWLDRFRDRSVTEMEFLRGHLNNPGDLPAFICFRDLKYDKEKAAEAKAAGDQKGIRKFTVEDDEASEKLTGLKNHVMLTENECVGLKMDYQTPAEGAKLMFEAIDSVLSKYLLADTTQVVLSKRETDTADHIIFKNARCRVHVGMDELKLKLDDFVSKESGTNQLLIVGEAGCGKSALLGNWIADREKMQADEILFYHFVGCNARSRDIHSILARIVLNLEHQLDRYKKNGTKFDDTESENAFYIDIKKKEKDKIKTEWRDVVKRIQAAGKNIIIVIDGLNWVEVPSKITRPLFWIPNEFPSCTKLIMSTDDTDSVSMKELIEERKVDQLIVGDLERGSRAKLCEHVLGLHGKALTESQMQTVVSSEKSGNPLFLQVTMEELFHFGRYRELDKKIADLMTSKSPEELFEKYLERLENDNQSNEYSGNIVEKVMTLLAVARNGLSESKITSMLDIQSHRWSPLFYGMESYLLKKENVIDFAHHELKMAVLKRYTTETKLTAARQLLAEDMLKDFMEKAESCNNTLIKDAEVAELCWYVRKLDDRRMMKDILSDYTLVESLLIFNRYELFEYLWYLDLPVEKLGEMLMQGLDNHICRKYVALQKDWKEVGPIAKRENVADQSENTKDELYHTIYNLACFYCDMFEPAKAMPLHMKVKDYYEKRISETENPSISLKAEMGYLYNGLGLTAQNLDNNEEALVYFEKSMETHKSIPEHEDWRENYNKAKNNYARTYLAMKQYPRAVELLEEVIKEEEEIYLEALTPAASYALTNLGICYRKVKDFDKAKVVYEKAMEIKKTALGEYHRDVGIAHVNMSNLALDHKKYDEMEMHLKKALDIYDRVGQADTDNAWKARENLALSLSIQEKFQEAEPIFWKTIERYIKRGELERFGLPALHRRMMMWYFHGENIEMLNKLAPLQFETKKLKKPMHYIIFHMVDEQLKTGIPPDRTLEEGLKMYPTDRDLLMYYIAAIILPKKNVQDVLDNLKVTSDYSVFDDIVDLCQEESWEDDLIVKIYEASIEKYRTNEAFIEKYANLFVKKDVKKAVAAYLNWENESFGPILNQLNKSFTDDNMVEMQILVDRLKTEGFKNKTLISGVEEYINDKRTGRPEQSQNVTDNALAETEAVKEHTVPPSLDLDKFDIPNQLFSPGEQKSSGEQELGKNNKEDVNNN